MSDTPKDTPTPEATSAPQASATPAAPATPAEPATPSAPAAPARPAAAAPASPARPTAKPAASTPSFEQMAGSDDGASGSPSVAGVAIDAIAAAVAIAFTTLLLIEVLPFLS